MDGGFFEGLDISHLVQAGFVVGVGAEGALVLRNARSVGLDQEADSRVFVPVEGHRVAIANDVVRLAVDVDAAPFAVEEVEIEFPLVGQRQPIPSFTELLVNSECALRVDEFEEFYQRPAKPLFDNVLQRFHKGAFLKFIK